MRIAVNQTSVVYVTLTHRSFHVKANYSAPVLFRERG